jgi:glycosyltransferase involved in cell wall biosynthesis
MSAHEMFRSLKQLRRSPRGAFKLSIAVRVRNELQHLRRFADSVFSQTAIDQAELIFLDSGSQDGTLEYIMGLDCSVYSLEHSEFSYGSSCNLMMSLAGADIVVFLSGHVVLCDKRMLEKAYAIFSNRTTDAGYFRQVPNPFSGASAYEVAYLERRFPAAVGLSLQRKGKHAFSNAASVVTRGAWRDNPFGDIIASEDFFWAERHLSKGRSLLYLGGIDVMHSHNERPVAVYRRVQLNVRARYGGRRQVGRAVWFFVGVFFSVLRVGGTLREAFDYAMAHSLPYLGVVRQEP